jgi:3-phenylpropionate/trans-cinnamate dioxygenase ferredoxin reductase subunit
MGEPGFAPGQEEDLMSSEETYVIVGASLAGAKAAQALREEGFDGRIVLVGAESELPYERPPLTKGFLQGKEEQAKVYVHEAGWYDKHHVELRLGMAASAVDRTARTVMLADGVSVPYDKLLLTTGSSPRYLDVPGAERVHYLRTLGDSLALREVIEPGEKRVVVIGAGWIGLETAAAAREYGNDVTIVEPAPAPLLRSVGPQIGELFASLHRRHGVEVLLNEGVASIGPDSVITSGGRELPADIVIVGIGVRPNIELGESAGLEVENGIVVDASLRTSDPYIYAAGDVANAYHPLLGRHLRVEHWANALNGGPAAGRSMLGHDVVYDRLPYFFTDQYELGMEMTGVPDAYDQVLFRGSAQDLEFIAFWLLGGKVVAAMNVNVWDVATDLQALIRSGNIIDPDRLTDPGTPLLDLL